MRQLELLSISHECRRPDVRHSQCNRRDRVSAVTPSSLHIRSHAHATLTPGPSPPFLRRAAQVAVVHALVAAGASWELPNMEGDAPEDVADMTNQRHLMQVSRERERETERHRVRERERQRESASCR